MPRRVGEPDWGRTADACQEGTLKCLWGSCTKPYTVADSLNRHVKKLTAPCGEHWRHILCRDISDEDDCTRTITASFLGCAAITELNVCFSVLDLLHKIYVTTSAKATRAAQTLQKSTVEKTIDVITKPEPESL